MSYPAYPSKRSALYLPLQFSLLLVFLLCSTTGQGQTYFPLSSGNYSEGFADLATWTSIAASGRDADYFSSVGTTTSGSIPDGNKTTVSSASFTSGNTGGVQKGNQALVLFSTGATNNTSAVAIDLNLSFANRTAGTLSFEYEGLSNSTGDRTSSLRVYYSVDGANYLEIPAASVTVTNNLASAGTVTTALPDELSGIPAAKLRFYNYNSAGGTAGSRPKIILDNISVSSTAGITTGSLTGTPVCATSASSITVGYTSSGIANGSYKVQLSDAAGAFSTSPTTLSTLSATSTTLTVAIAAGTASGTAYKVRVVAESEGKLITGSASSTFAIVSNPTVTISPRPTVTTNSNTVVSFTGSETPGVVSREWLYSTASRSYTTATGNTSLNYAFDAATPGTYYVVLRSVFASCGVVVSAETQVMVYEPAVVAITAALAPFSTAAGLPSVAQSFTVEGSVLREDITVGPTTGYEFSTTSATAGFAATQTLARTNAAVPLTTVYVRLTGATPTAALGTSIPVTSAGATPPAIAVVGSVVAKWDGGGDRTSFADARNWSNDQVPVGGDLLLDHSFVAEAYTMTFPATATGTLALNSLAIAPSGGAAITVLLPNTNTVVDYLRLTAATNALVIQSGGVFINNSGAGSGGTGHPVDVTSAGQNFIIYNGGTYVHRTSRGVGLLIDNISTASGTETGLVQFDVPGGGSFIIPSTGRTYGNLTLTYPATSPPPASGFFSYITSGSSAFVVRGTLTMAANVSFAVSLNNTMSIGGNLVNNGRFRFEPSALTSPRRLIMNGTAPQVISGSALTEGTTGTSQLGQNVILQINNPAGVTLGTSVALNSQNNANSGGLELLNGVLTTSSTFPLKLAAGAVLLPAAAGTVSYVNGPLQRAIAATPATAAAAEYLFPIGQNGKYRPLTLNVAQLDALTTFTATQQEGATPDGRLNGDLTRVSRVRYYSVAPAVVPAAFSGSITLSFGSDDEVTNPALPTLVIAKNGGSGWVNIGRTSNTSTSLTSGTFTAFSDFALASTDPLRQDNPLPVQLTSFAAERQPTSVVIRWATASESNSAYFEVERSLDGRAFGKVAAVGGQGQSRQAQHYLATDPQPLAQRAYYRLRQVDQDGSVAYSPVAVVPGIAAVAAYPNPVRDVLTVRPQGLPTANVAVQLTDLSGRVVWQSTLLPSGQLNMRDLPAGAYVLYLDEGTTRSIQRIVKE